MDKIYKYKIPIEDEIIIDLPKGAKILTVQVQNEQPCIWAIVDPLQPFEKRNLYLYGTGMTVTHCESYIGTFQIYELVFHLFEFNKPF